MTVHVYVYENSITTLWFESLVECEGGPWVLIREYDKDIPDPVGPGGTTDYNQLSNKPLINSVTLSGNKTSEQLNIQGEPGPEGPQGEQGPAGPQGQQGDKGDKGENGFSPAVTITDITGGHRVNITDKDHPQGQSFDVMDGEGGQAESVDWSKVTNKPTDLVQDASYVHTDNNFTTQEKNKLTGLSNYDDTALAARVTANEAAIAQTDALVANKADKGEAYTKSETDTLLDGYAEAVELTQAEYNALSEAEKKNGKIYFITDAESGGDGDTFTLIENPSRVFNMTYAELKAAHEAHKQGWFLGSGGNVFPIIGLIYRATPSEHILVITGSGELDRRVITFYPDGSSNYEYTDTGWLTVEGEYIDWKCRKKNGVVYITFSGSIVKKEIPAGSVTIGTLPTGCIPTQHIGGALVDRSGACKGFLVARPSGAFDAYLTGAIGVSAVSTIASGLSYPV